jgi:hypothetical protein
MQVNGILWAVNWKGIGKESEFPTFLRTNRNLEKYLCTTSVLASHRLDCSLSHLWSSQPKRYRIILGTVPSTSSAVECKSLSEHSIPKWVVLRSTPGAPHHDRPTIAKEMQSSRQILVAHTFSLKDIHLAEENVFSLNFLVSYCDKLQVIVIWHSRFDERASRHSSRGITWLSAVFVWAVRPHFYVLWWSLMEFMVNY